jgi:hypothetical protein
MNRRGKLLLPSPRPSFPDRRRSPPCRVAEERSAAHPPAEEGEGHPEERSRAAALAMAGEEAEQSAAMAMSEQGDEHKAAMAVE